MKFSLIKELKSYGGVIIKPNPILKNIPSISKSFNRFHQKLVLIDDDLFIGSINNSDEYSGPKYGSFKYIDLNLYIRQSPCVGKVVNFFKDIVIDSKRKIRLKKFPWSDKRELNPDEIFDNIYFSNTNGNYSEQFLEENRTKTEIQDSLYEILSAAHESITLIQCYYLNINKIEDILLDALRRGVKVQIITAAIRDQQVYKYIDNEVLFKSLLEEGAEVYEFLDKSFHMKAYYVDRNVINLGSFNNDITSFAVNNEANYLVRQDETNLNLFKDFDAMIENVKKNCRQIKITGEYSKFRYYVSQMFYSILWLMEKTIVNKQKYKSP